MQFNVVHGAQGGTLAAADAAVVHRKCPVMDAGGVKNRVDDIGHKLAKHRGFRFRYRTAAFYGSSGLLQRRHRSGQQFRGGDGIISEGVENTIRNIGMLGHDGMRETDKEIVKIMMQKP